MDKLDLTDGLAIVALTESTNLKPKEAVFLGVSSGALIYLTGSERAGLERLRDRIDETLKCA